MKTRLGDKGLPGPLTSETGRQKYNLMIQINRHSLYSRKERKEKRKGRRERESHLSNLHCLSKDTADHRPMGLTRVQYSTEAWETQALGGCTHQSPWGSPADEGRAGPPRRPGWCRPSASRGRRAGWSQTAAGVLGDRRDLCPAVWPLQPTRWGRGPGNCPETLQTRQNAPRAAPSPPGQRVSPEP